MRHCQLAQSSRQTLYAPPLYKVKPTCFISCLVIPIPRKSRSVNCLILSPTRTATSLSCSFLLTDFTFRFPKGITVNLLQLRDSANSIHRCGKPKVRCKARDRSIPCSLDITSQGRVNRSPTRSICTSYHISDFNPSGRVAFPARRALVLLSFPGFGIVNIRPSRMTAVSSGNI